MPENLPREQWKLELADDLSGLVEHLKKLDAQIQATLDVDRSLSADGRQRLADLQDKLRAPQNFFTEASKFVGRWL
jgi:hypothetical protein